jgi:DNA repair protein RecN (Recombination protein N)
MAQCRLDVMLNNLPVTSTGIDTVEFLISPNAGEPLKPLAKIASGGELSRVMLALKTVLSRAAYVPTLIFDEIDIGVGGRTASTIACKLATLSHTAQVLCITHLPQIAAQPASAHFSINKREDAGRTTIQISALDEEGRVEEIARMLGGTRQTETVLRHAREMLNSPVALT